MIGFSRCSVFRYPVETAIKTARHRGVSSSCRLRAKDIKRVPVATYGETKGVGTTGAQRTTLAVDGSKSASKPPLSEDIGRQAVAFDDGVVQKMTPTLKSFMLEGKVAVVTG